MACSRVLQPAHISFGGETLSESDDPCETRGVIGRGNHILRVHLATARLQHGAPRRRCTERAPRRELHVHRDASASRAVFTRYKATMNSVPSLCTFSVVLRVKAS